MYTLHYLSRAVEAVLEALVVPLVILLAAVLVIAAVVEIRDRWRRRRPQTVTKAAERRARAGAPRRDHRRGCQGCERRNAPSLSSRATRMHGRRAQGCTPSIGRSS